MAAFVLVLAPTRSTQSRCRKPDDTSARIVHYVTFLLTDTSQASARARDSIGIANVQPSQIAAVTDTRTCSKIGTFFDHFEGVTRTARRVYTSSFSRTWFSDRAGGPSFFPRPNRPALKDLLSGGRQILRACGAQDDRPVPFAKSSPPVPLSAYAERGNDGTDCGFPSPEGRGDQRGDDKSARHARERRTFLWSSFEP